MTKDRIDRERLALGAAAVLTCGRAARLLGGRRAMAWLRAHVPRYTGPTGECVIWGEVLEALRRQALTRPEAQETEPVATRRRALLPADLKPDPL